MLRIFVNGPLKDNNWLKSLVSTCSSTQDAGNGFSARRSHLTELLNSEQSLVQHSDKANLQKWALRVHKRKHGKYRHWIQTRYSEMKNKDLLSKTKWNFFQRPKKRPFDYYIWS